MQTILVCDDDKQIVEAIDIYLTGEGFEVIKAYDCLLYTSFPSPLPTPRLTAGTC